MPENYQVNHPEHYNKHPSGVECIQITEHMNFCRGNAIKYIWRAGEKGNEIEDLKKASWYIQREIEKLESDRHGNPPDDKIPKFSGMEAELADAIIRILDLAGARGYDIGGAIIAKMEYNTTRPHKHGKKY